MARRNEGGTMTVREAGQRGGQRVRELIERGKRNELEMSRGKLEDRK